MTKIFSKKLSEFFFKTDNYLILTSPYKDNNLLIFLTLNEKGISSKVFKYIFDPTEPEIKYCNDVPRNQEIQSALQLKVHVQFLLPGRIKNELILVTTSGDIWIAFEINNSIKLSKRVGKVDFNNIDEKSFSFFEIFDPIDIVAYFTKKTKDFACLVIKEIDRFYLLFNTELFLKVNAENSTLEFENSIAFWNSAGDNLDLFSFNEKLGLVHISFPRNKINQEVPISIKNLKKFIDTPKDICCINDNLYVITESNLHIYSNFKKYRTLKSVSLDFSTELVWFEPQYRRAKVIDSEGNFFDFVFSPTLSEISAKRVLIENKQKIKIENCNGIKCLGNKQFGIIYGGSLCYIWVKKEHISVLKTHSIILSELKSSIPNALKSLQRLKDLKIMDFDQLISIAEAGLPKSLLKLRKRTIRFFTKEEDIFIIEHAYLDLSFPSMAKKFNRTPISIYTHLKMSYGTPTCEEHSTFQKTCDCCNEARKIWVDECKKIIEIKKYPKYDIEEGVTIEFDYEDWLKKDKKRRLKRGSSFFIKVLPLQMYNDILDFIVETDLLKGRSLNSIFEQCIQIFIDDFLRDCIIKGKSAPYHLLELYFGIKKDMKTLRIIFPPYRKLINPKYRPIGDYNFFFKDLMNLRKLYSQEVCDVLRPHLLNLYKEMSKLGIKDGYLAALLYIISIEKNKRITQAELADIFLITEVTLRTRMKNVKELMNHGKNLEIIREISQIIITNKSIKETIEDEQYYLIHFNSNIKNLFYRGEYQNIQLLLTELEIYYIEENLPLVSESLELISKIQNNLIISLLIDFLIEYDYYNESIFNNIIKCLSFADDSIVDKVSKLIHHFNPNLERADICELLDALPFEQNALTLSYISAKLLGVKKNNSIKE